MAALLLVGSGLELACGSFRLYARRIIGLRWASLRVLRVLLILPQRLLQALLHGLGIPHGLRGPVVQHGLERVSSCGLIALRLLRSTVLLGSGVLWGLPVARCLIALHGFHISPLDIGFTPCMVTVHLIRQAFGVAAGIDVIGTLEWVDIVVVVE